MMPKHAVNLQSRRIKEMKDLEEGKYKVGGELDIVMSGESKRLKKGYTKCNRKYR